MPVIMALELSEVTHIIAHLTIFLGYIGFAVLVPGIISRIIHVRTLTKLSGGGFFLTCGITHIGLALDRQDTPLISVTDHLQAGFVLAFGLMIALDFRDAYERLQKARLVAAARSGEVGEEVFDLFRSALRDLR